MKSLIVIVVASMVMSQASAQKIDSASVAKLSPEKRYELNGYLHKAKNAKTTALVLCIAGGSLAIAGIAVAVHEIEKDVWFDGKEPPTTNADDILIFTGVAAGLASIPFFINVHKQREKARAILYQDKGVSLAPGIILPNTRSYGLRLAIPIGK